MKLNEYEREQSCITEESRVYPMKYKILSENITPKIISDAQLQTDHNENLIEHAEDEICEQQFIHSPFKLHQLTLTS